MNSFVSLLPLNLDNLILFTISILLCFFLSAQYLIIQFSVKIYTIEIAFLFSSLLVSLVLIVNLSHLFYIYVTLELISFIIYLVAGKLLKTEYEGLVKYFIFNNVASLLILFSITSLLSLFDGTNLFIFGFELSQFSSHLSFHLTPLIILFFLTGLTIKLGTLPLSWWIVDFYENIPFSLLGLLILVLKTTYFILIIKILFIAFFIFPEIITIFLINLGLSSLLLGAIASLIQNKFKRFLAYASLNQIGYVLLSINFLTYNSFYITVLYFLTYTLTIFFLLHILLTIMKNPILYLTDLIKLTTMSFFKKAWLGLLLFSLSALPPLFGFFIKFSILLLLTSNYYFLLTGIVIVFGLFSIYYYSHLIKLLFFISPPYTLFRLVKK